MKTAQQTLQETYVTLEQVEEMIHNATINHETNVPYVLIAPHTIEVLREFGYRVVENVGVKGNQCTIHWGPRYYGEPELPNRKDYTMLPPQPPAWMYITIGVLVLAIIIVYIFKIHV